MSSNLHGGGNHYISRLTINQIDSAYLDGKIQRLEFASPSGPSADADIISLERYEDKSRKSPFVMKIGQSARRELGLPVSKSTGKSLSKLEEREELALAEAVSLDDVIAPNLYFKLVETDGIFQPLDSGLMQKVAINTHLPRPGANTMNIAPIYTYFGQFLTHDLTLMEFSGAPGMEWNHRSHALDLDSVFGEVPVDLVTDPGWSCEEIFLGGHLHIGPDTAGECVDLPRATDGNPVIPDPRNDNNLIVAQFHVLLLKFAKKLCAIHTPATVQDLQRITAKYIQYIMLNDYLPKIVEEPFLLDLNAQHPRKIVFPSGVHDDFQVSREFAGACFRFGHSMVRRRYNWNGPQETEPLSRLIEFTHIGTEMHASGRLPKKWAIDWDFFLQSQAMAIDLSLSHPMRELKSAFIKPDQLPEGMPPGTTDTFDLSLITLLRANDLRLPNAQQMCTLLSGVGLCDPDTLLQFPAEHRIATGLSDMELASLNANLPLWLYVLFEAERQPNGKLGPIGGTVVAETLHAAVEAAAGNILEDTDFAIPPEISGGAPEDFDLGRLIQFAIT